jgi:hypothetical protein
MARGLRENQEMAQAKISTLELEIKQQNDFFKKQESNYEKQDEVLKEEVQQLR